MATIDNQITTHYLGISSEDRVAIKLVKHKWLGQPYVCCAQHAPASVRVQ